MKTFTSPEELHAWSMEQKRQGRTVGLVPTMGCLHEGHLSLIREAKKHCDAVVVSIFVNPTQFAPNEDYAAYPRKEETDCALCDTEGASAVFLPKPETHFRGVCTIVAKLFNIVAPDVAVFGQKDFQQEAVIRRMVRDLNFPIRVIRAPIVRDPDGLAKSSRNAYLSPEMRTSALSLSRALFAAKQAVEAGERSSAVLEDAVRKEVTASGWVPDYATVVDAQTLEPLAEVRPGSSAFLLACRKAGLRLIDNVLL